MSYRVLVTCPPMLGLIDEFRYLFSEKGIDIYCPPVKQTLSVEELQELLPQFDGWIIGDDPANAEVFKAGHQGKLKAAVKWGVGVDNVDFKAAKELGIPITNTPRMFGGEVADVAVGYVIGLARQTFWIDREVRKGNWIKPSGTSSLVLGTSSGIHAWHNDYYIRRMRVGKNEAIYSYLAIYHPELIEDEYFRPHDTAVISVPQKSPEGSILRHESALELLERVKWFYTNWIKEGHRTGQNTHNISATVSIKIDEWDTVGEWMWNNRKFYNGLSVLPYADHTYIQAPFEDCTEEKYEEMMKSLSNIDLSKVVEMADNTDLKGEVACGADGCEIK